MKLHTYENIKNFKRKIYKTQKNLIYNCLIRTMYNILVKFITFRVFYVNILVPYSNILIAL